jgi:hypothetical protein
MGGVCGRDTDGTTIVQDPEEAAFDAMPLSALRAVEIDHVLPAAQIGEKIVELVKSHGQPSCLPVQRLSKRCLSRRMKGCLRTKE